MSVFEDNSAWFNDDFAVTVSYESVSMLAVFTPGYEIERGGSRVVRTTGLSAKFTIQKSTLTQPAYNDKIVYDSVEYSVKDFHDSVGSWIIEAQSSQRRSRS